MTPSRPGNARISYAGYARPGVHTPRPVRNAQGLVRPPTAPRCPIRRIRRTSARADGMGGVWGRCGGGGFVLLLGVAAIVRRGWTTPPPPTSFRPSSESGAPDSRLDAVYRVHLGWWTGWDRACGLVRAMDTGVRRYDGGGWGGFGDRRVAGVVCPFFVVRQAHHEELRTLAPPCTISP